MTLTPYMPLIIFLLVILGLAAALMPVFAGNDQSGKEIHDEQPADRLPEVPARK